jgi:tRNA (cytidine/uridine-2'-O-)-methyltransferase
MLDVALLEPDNPPNTGNIARLCAATRTPLHLIGRLGFRLDQRSLRRAGVDYWDAVDLHRHATWAAFEEAMQGRRLFCLSAHATTVYTSAVFQPGDCLLFGSESRGLPTSILEQYAATALRIPILSPRVRSLNLATAVSIVLYEALRQLRAW